MANPRRRHEVEHPIQNSRTSTQNGYKTQFFALHLERIHRLQRRLNPYRLQRQIPQHLIAQQQRNLPRQPPKIPGRGFAFAQQRKLVLHQRVVDDGNVAHAPLAQHNIAIFLSAYPSFPLSRE